jgi:hypothetical protein
MQEHDYGKAKKAKWILVSIVGYQEFDKWAYSGVDREAGG